VSVRRVALLISILTLVAFATPVASAAAETPTLPQLRTQLRQTRQRLANAREALASARSDLTNVLAVVSAQGVATMGADPTPADPVTTGDAPVTDPTATSAAAVAASTLDEAGIATLVASLDPSLAAVLLADGVIAQDEIAALQDRVDKWRDIARRLRRAESTLQARIAQRLRIADWNRRGAWRPLIEIAARRNGVDPDGLYRLMMYESGGRRCAGSTYRGLFQYYPGTWSASWNPWRSESICNGWAQIRATAYAIRRGMGPGSWPSTYYRAF
jgi:soluble lytic murein transglycosylase-like protein